jgi:hypothetical protein
MLPAFCSAPRVALGLDIALQGVTGFAKRLAERRLHCADLLRLPGDDIPRDSAQFRVVAVLQLGLGHLDCALMVRDHHGDEVGIDIAMSCIILLMAAWFPAMNDASAVLLVEATCCAEAQAG